MYTDEKGSKVLEENNIYLLPRKTYKLQSDNNMKEKYYWCYVNSSKPQYYNDVVKINDNNFLYSSYINIIKNILDSYAESTAEDDIKQISNQDPYYSVICNTINALLEFHWVENYYKEDCKFDCITEYIQNNLNKDLSNDTLARISMYNKAYFIKTFKSVFKETPQKYVERLRLAEAVSLILKNEKVETIALSIGYGSAKSFSRAFKRQTGFSPSEYRTKQIIKY